MANTDFIPNPRFITLRYRIKDDYDPTELINNGVRPADYVTALCMPLREMTTTDTAPLAREAINCVQDNPNMRRLHPGDMFYKGNEIWVFIDPKHQHIFGGVELIVVPAEGKAKELLLARLETAGVTAN